MKSKMSKWDILILDRSASMIHNMDKLKHGFNSLVDELKSIQLNSRLTVIGFNSVVEIIKDEYFPNVYPLEDSHYYALGMTALLDAVGNAYDLIIADPKYDDITLTVITDGEENCSKYYDFKILDEKKIQINKTRNLKFVFMGADSKCIENNIIKPHVSQSLNYRGDIIQAMRTASQSISRECLINKDSSQDYVESKPFLKRDSSILHNDPPSVKKCKGVCSTS